MKTLKRTFLCLISLGIMQISHAQNWFQKGIDIDGEAAGDWSGYSVCMPDAKTIAIGALTNSDNGYGSGQVRIYHWNNGVWVQKGADLNGLADNDWFGRSVSMPDANTIAIGVPTDGGNILLGGYVQIYKWNGSAWIQKGLNIDAEAIFDQAGYSVSMPDSNTVAFGAVYNAGNSINTGHTRIYKWNGSTWVQKGNDIDGEADTDQAGYFISMPDSNNIAIGSPFNTENSFAAGQVRVYSWNGTIWQQKGADIDGVGIEDWLGLSVSMPDANTLAVGIPNNDFNGLNAGQVRILKWNGTAWTQKGPSIYGLAPGDQSGYSVNMPDSNTVAVDSHGNDENGNDAGQVRVFKWNGSNWIQKGSNINGEAPGDVSGLSLFMPDSLTIAIGGPWNDQNGNSAGHVRIYNFCSITTSTIAPTACNSYVSPSGINTWTTSGTYSDIILNNAGCDSIITINLTIINSTSSTITPITCNNYVSPSGNQTWTISGTYSDIVTNSVGCDSVITINLTIINSTSSTITPIACNNYVSPSGNQTWTISGTYSDIIPNSVGCDSIISINLTINNISEINTTTSGITISSNNINASYQWLNCTNGYSIISGANNQSYTAPLNGSYAVELTENGCKDTSACVTINTVDIIENYLNEKYILSPNPSNGQAYITSESEIYNTNIIIRNILGQEIFRNYYIETKRIDINIEGSNGIYFLEIVKGDKKTVLKLIKE